MRLRSFSRFWAILLGSSLLVAVLLVAWFVSLQLTAQEVEDSYNRQQLLLVEAAAIGVEEAFVDLQADLSTLSRLPGVQALDETAVRTDITTAFNDLSDQGVSEIGLLDAAGVAQVFVVRPELEQVDYSWRAYFREAAAMSPDADALVVELDASSQESVFYFALPVFPPEGGGVRGVLVMTLSVDSIAQRTLAPFVPPGGQLLLIHDDFEVMWSSEPSWTGTNLFAGRLEAFSALTEEMDAWRGGETRSGRYRFGDPGQRSARDLIAYAPVRLGSELLAVAIETPAEVARQASFTAFRNQQTVLLVSISLLLGGAIAGGLILNIETRRRFAAEEALRLKTREQAVLEERSRLASDLHDSVTQGLYGIVLHADAAKAKLAAGAGGEAAEYLSEISDAGREGLAEMRMLIFELRPPVLADEGLQAALEARLYAVERRMGLKAGLQWQLDGRLPLEVEDGLYRIAREALNNVLKHASARTLTISVARSNGMVRMRVADDGTGFDPSDAENGMGLEIMQERAEKMGGTARVKSAPGSGTEVIVEVQV